MADGPAFGPAPGDVVTRALQVVGRRPTAINLKRESNEWVDFSFAAVSI